jgi:hypothetical protein
MSKQICLTAAIFSLISQAFAGDWGTTLSFETRTSTEPIGKQRNLIENTLEFIPYYQLDAETSFYGHIAVTKDLKNDRETSLSNAFVGVSRALTEFETLSGKLSGEIRLYAPTNETSRDDQSLRSRIYLSSSLKIPVPQLINAAVTLRLNGYKNFNEFKTSASGAVVTDRAFSEYISFSLSPLESITLSAYATNTHYWNAYGTRTNDNFETGLAAAYAFNQATGLEIGQTLGGRTFGPSGSDFSVDFYDRDQSTLYVLITHSF